MTSFGLFLSHQVFEEADTDKDGHLTAEEAREVYLKSNLDLQVLRRVWELVRRAGCSPSSSSS